jgi:hypothetical protein
VVRHDGALLPILQVLSLILKCPTLIFLCHQPRQHPLTPRLHSGITIPTFASMDQSPILLLLKTITGNNGSITIQRITDTNRMAQEILP